MKKLKFWLTGLLFAQLLLAIALLFFNQWEEQKSKPKPILAIDWNNVDKLIVEDNDSDVTLTKTENTWVLSNTKLPNFGSLVIETAERQNFGVGGWARSGQLLGTKFGSFKYQTTEFR